MSKNITIDDLQNILGTVEKASSVEPLQLIPTNIIGLDRKVLGGGLPRGRYVEIFSKESSGKSTLALFLVAMIQKQGGVCCWYESEGSFTQSYAKTCGVDVSKLDIIRNFTTGEDCLYKIKQRLAINYYDLIVLDSNTKLTPESIMQAKADRSTQYDNLQRSMMNANFFTSLSGYEIRDIKGNLIKSNKIYLHGNKEKNTWHRLSDKKTCLVFILHARDDVTALRTGSITSTGGSGSKFEASIRLALKLRSSVKDSGGNLLYKKIDVIAIKNKIAVPFGRIRLLLYPDGKVEEEDSDEILIDIAIAKELIKQSGGWFYIGKEKFQGKSKIIEYINDNLVFKEEILK